MRRAAIAAGLAALLLAIIWATRDREDAAPLPARDEASATSPSPHSRAASIPEAAARGATDLETKGAITGRVVDATGRPMPGVPVHLGRAEDRGVKGALLDACAPDDDTRYDADGQAAILDTCREGEESLARALRVLTAPTIARSVDSGADGSFSIEAIDLGEYTLWAEPPGQITPARELLVADEPLEVELVVPTSFSISGRVVTGASYLPIAGARVSSREILAGRTLSAITTDALGRFRLAIAPSQPFVVLAEADGYASLALSHPKAKGDLVIRLEPAGEIRGVVTHDGAPAAGATILVDQQRETTSGPDGRFTITGLSLSDYELEARLGDRAGFVQVTMTGPVTTVALALSARCKMGVWVVDSVGRAQVERLVDLIDGSGPEPRILLTDGRGFAELDLIGEGPYVFFTSEDDRTTVPRCVREMRLVVQVQPGLSGTVVDENGLPIAGASVALRDPETGGSSDVITTSPDGHYHFDLEPREGNVSASKNGFRDVERPFAFTGKDVTVDLVLSRPPPPSRGASFTRAIARCPGGRSRPSPSVISPSASFPTR